MHDAGLWIHFGDAATCSDRNCRENGTADKPMWRGIGLRHGNAGSHSDSGISHADSSVFDRADAGGVLERSGSMERKGSS